MTVMTWMMMRKVAIPEELQRPGPGSSLVEETNVSQGPQDVDYHQQAGRSTGAGAQTGAGGEGEGTGAVDEGEGKEKVDEKVKAPSGMVDA